MPVNEYPLIIKNVCGRMFGWDYPSSRDVDIRVEDEGRDGRRERIRERETSRLPCSFIGKRRTLTCVKIANKIGT